MIERAKNDNDPWSGHLAMPGGTIEPVDAHARDAAERETLEEIGVCLNNALYLGRLDDIDADNHPLIVSCYVYGLEKKPSCTTEPAEVADVFWLPLSSLEEDTRQLKIHPIPDDPSRSFPAIKVPGKEQPLWGITYKILRNFRKCLKD